MPEFRNLGKLKRQSDGRLKGTLKYPFNRSTKLEIGKVTVEEIPQDRLSQQDIEHGNTHRVFHTIHSEEEDREYYSEKGGNDVSQPQGSGTQNQIRDDAPF